LGGESETPVATGGEGARGSQIHLIVFSISVIDGDEHIGNNGDLSIPLRVVDRSIAQNDTDDDDDADDNKLHSNDESVYPQSAHKRARVIVSEGDIYLYIYIYIYIYKYTYIYIYK
jgi:hypothetical protein